MKQNRFISTNALILKINKVNEKNKLVYFLSPTLGLQKGYAYGGMSLNNKTTAALDHFCICHFLLYKKEKDELYTIKEVKLLNMFYPIRNHLKRYYSISFFNEIYLNISIPENEAKYYYNLLYNLQTYIETLNIRKIDQAIIFFLIRLLKIMGFCAPFHICVVCQTRKPPFFLSVKYKGIVCLSHYQSQDCEIGDSALEKLIKIQNEPFNEIVQLSFIKEEEKIILGYYLKVIKIILDKPIKTLDVLKRSGILG